MQSTLIIKVSMCTHSEKFKTARFQLHNKIFGLKQMYYCLIIKATKCVLSLFELEHKICMQRYSFSKGALIQGMLFCI